MSEGKISVSYVVNSSEYNKNINAMRNNMKLLNVEIQTSAQEVVTYGNNVTTLTKKQESISKAIEQSKKIIEEYEKQLVKNNSSLEKNKNKLSELAKEKEDANKTYKDAIKIYGEESEEALKAKEALDEVTKSYEKQEKKVTSNQNAIRNNLTQIERTKQEQLKLQKQLEDTNKAIEEQGDKFADSSEKFVKAGKKLQDAGGSLKDLGENAQKAGALIVAAGVGLGTMALDTQNTLNTLSGRLGATAEEAENLKQVAKTLYTNGFGESLDDCVNDLVLLQQNIKETANMTDEQKGKLLEQISTVKTLFGAESEEITKTLNNMLKNGLIDNLEEGLDLIVVGFQNGLNSSGDLLDVLYEYSSQFKKLGLDGQSALEMIKAGLDAGGYNADKMADALKELSIRVIDGSDTTTEGFELMGKNAEEMARKFAAGGDSAKEALQETIEGLKNIQDPLEQDLAGVDLFGTMWEDSSKEAILAMGNIEGGLGDITGATEKAGKEVNESIGKRFTSSMRKLKDELIPLGEALLPILDDAIDGIGNVADIIAKLDPSIVKLVAKFGAMALVFGTVTKAGGSLVTTLGKGAEGISTLLKVAGDTKELGSLTKALGNSETAIGGLIKGFSSLGSVAGLSATAVLPVIAAVTAVTAGVYAWNKGQDAINKTVVESKGEYTGLEKVMASLMGVQLRSREELESLGLIYKDFNENISDEFQESVKEMTTDVHEFAFALNDVTLDGVFSEEEANNMTSRVDNAMKSTLAAIENKAQEMQEGLGKAFGVDGLIDENEQALLEYWDSRGTKEKEEAQNLQNEINKIITTARNEGRNLTAEEEAKIKDYYAQIKQIELEALASNQYEIEYATQEFLNRISTMDAEEAKKLLGQRYEQYKEQELAIKTNYDTLIAMAQEGYASLSEEEKKKVDETVARLEESKTKELEINKKKYDESLDEAYKHNQNLKNEFNRFTGELNAEGDKSNYEQYEKMLKHYADIENVTKSGYQKIYDYTTKTWEDLYVSIDEKTGQIKGVYDLNTTNIIAMNEKDKAVLNDEATLWKQTSEGILANALVIGNAYVDASGQITNASGTIIGKLGQVKNANGELVDAILDVNGNPIKIGENTADVIKKLKETQTQVKNTDGMKAQITVTDSGTISTVQRNINNISGKTVTVGVKYSEDYIGNRIYATGTQATSESQHAIINEGNTWELVDTPKDTTAFSLGRVAQGEMAYLPKNTRVTTALASTEKMRAAVKEEVAKSTGSLNSSELTKLVRNIYEVIKNESLGNVNITNETIINAKTNEDLEKIPNNIESLVKQELRKFGKIK